MTRRPAALLGVQVAIVTAILGCLLALAALHPKRLDLTPERRFTLSSYTREILGRLSGDVRVTLFYSSQAGATLVRAAVRGEEKSVVAPCSAIARRRRIACTTVTSGSTHSTRY